MDGLDQFISKNKNYFIYSYQMVIVAPSILSSDFSRLGEECEKIIEAGADWIHVDVMDGHFVPNITIGPMIVSSLRSNFPGVFLDCHLMVSDAAKWAKEFVQVGASSITVHLECFTDCNSIIDLFSDLKRQYRDLKVAVALKPNTPVNLITDKLLTQCDMILVMTVEPGFGGQSMITKCLVKCRELRNRGYKGLIQVDGGVTVDNCEMVRDSGADVLVAGTAIFKAKDQKEAIRIIKGSF